MFRITITIAVLFGVVFADLRGGKEGESMDLKRSAKNMASAAVLLEDGLDATEIQRLKGLKASLLPLFESLPKNQHGKLATDVARYALHRLFEQQHDYSVNGLHSGGNTKQENLFGQLTADAKPEGVSMNDLALLAMLLEHRIHQETVTRVASEYVAQNRSTSTEKLSDTETHDFVERYMMIHIAGFTDDFLDKAGPRAQWEETPEGKATLGWAATSDGAAMLEWIHAAQQDVMRKQKLCSHGAGLCPFDFEATSHMVEEVLKSYGRFHHGMCKGLKSALLESENRKTGRVTLADFYRTGNSNKWNLHEKPDYLRDLGALDESVPGQPRVIVVNYVNARSNCMQSSSMYSVCCRNECEDLMGHLERNIKAPTDTPERILQLVNVFLDSSHDMLATKDSIFSRIASQLQKDRLYSIAEKHGGEVPLHGRLFAQWLHHVFPQNCPFPHQAGTTNPLTPQEWMQEEGQQEQGHQDYRATREEISQVFQTVDIDSNGAVLSTTKILESVQGNSTPDELDEDGEHSMQWSDEEEVFTIRHEEAPMQSTPRWRSNVLVMVFQVLVMAGIIHGLSTKMFAQRPKHLLIV